MGSVLLRLQQSVALEDLAEYLAGSSEKESLLEFILAIDAAVAELDFTKELYQTLSEVIDLEEGRV